MATKHVRVSRPGSNPARESDLKIAQAIKSLMEIERGRSALVDFKRLASGPAKGLDLAYMSELMVLVRAWAVGGRRDFLDGIPSPELKDLINAVDDADELRDLGMVVADRISELED